MTRQIAAILRGSAVQIEAMQDDPQAAFLLLL